jgi:hypothetical protein
MMPKHRGKMDSSGFQRSDHRPEQKHRNLASQSIHTSAMDSINLALTND